MVGPLGLLGSLNNSEIHPIPAFFIIYRHKLTVGYAVLARLPSCRPHSLYCNKISDGIVFETNHSIDLAALIQPVKLVH